MLHDTSVKPLLSTAAPVGRTFSFKYPGHETNPICSQLMNDDFPEEWLPRIITVALLRGVNFLIPTSEAMVTIPLSPQHWSDVGFSYRSNTLWRTPSCDEERDYMVIVSQYCYALLLQQGLSLWILWRHADEKMSIPVESHELETTLCKRCPISASLAVLGSKKPCNWSLISSILHITYSIFDFATANPFSNLIFCKVVCCVMSLSLVGFRLFGRDGATPWLPATVTVAFMTYTQLWLQMNDSHLVVHFMDLSFGNCRVSWPETESHVFSTTQKALDLDSFCVSLPLCGNRHVMCLPFIYCFGGYCACFLLQSIICESSIACTIPVQIVIVVITLSIYYANDRISAYTITSWY